MNSTISTNNFTKNENDYIFTLNGKGNMITKNTPVAQSEDGCIKIYLNGSVYNYNVEGILSGFQEEREKFADRLEGSFVIFLQINEEFVIITDSFNSKKAYYSINNSKIYISNNIDYLRDDKLSLEGIGSYLVNGVMINGVTLFENVRSFSRGSINKFDGIKIDSYVYKKYEFNYDVNVNKDILKKELQQLIINSVSKRYKASTSVAMSLSAGWDARGILGVLGEEIQAKNIECFSYAKSQTPKPNTDGYISNSMASIYNFKHKMVESYSGDIVSFLKNNALHGKGIANICYEIDAWLSLENDEGYSDIFVGDEIFGWQNVHLSSKEDVLDSVYIKKASSIKWLKPFLSEEVFEKVSVSIDQNIDSLYEGTNNIKDLDDKKDFLYLEHRINNILMPWRELFSNKVGFVHNPFLDENILKFMTKVPPSLRKDKRLFRLAISELFPDLFSIPKATDPGHIENWRNEIIQSESELIDMVTGTESFLDDIISKENLIKLIKLQKSKINKAKTFGDKGVNYIRKRIPQLDKRLNKIIGKRNPQVDSTTIVLRLLILRIYLKP